MRHLIFSLTLSVLVLPAPDLHSQKPPQATVRFGDPTGIGRHFQNLTYGIVKKISYKEIVLTKTQFGTTPAFQIVKKTKYICDGKRASADTVKVGDSVYIDVKEDKKGNLIAKRIITGVFATRTR